MESIESDDRLLKTRKQLDDDGLVAAAVTTAAGDVSFLGGESIRLGATPDGSTNLNWAVANADVDVVSGC